jgi:hypothetical protein
MHSSHTRPQAAQAVALELDWNVPGEHRVQAERPAEEKRPGSHGRQPIYNKTHRKNLIKLGRMRPKIEQTWPV